MIKSFKIITMEHTLLPDEAGTFDWSPGGKLCLELIKSEIEKNGRLKYAQEILGNSPSFTSFVKQFQSVKTHVSSA